MNNGSKCPVDHGSDSQHTQGMRSNYQWWPDNINVDILHQHDKKSNPMNGFDYRQEFQNLDYDALKKDLNDLINAGLSLSAASKYLAKKNGLKKSEIYNMI